MSLLELPVIQDRERFRAELASVAPDGKRKWIYAKKPSGSYYRWRTVVATLLLIFLAAAPFVTIAGNQFLLFDILDRKFVFFGLPFWPDDLYLVAVLFLLAVVSIVIFTATLGRLWCGWLCPQTVFLEMVFRKIEWLIDGTPGAQMLRNRGPWNWSRIWRVATKQTVFLAISWLIANIFLAYIISGNQLAHYVQEGPIAHLETFLGLAFFTLLFYGVFARYREQACLVACPYGRFMSALVDDNTVTVTYDTKRGEQRSKWKRGDTRVTQVSGHCIDCYQCVTVCPTGIDIRNGIQLECVACTACIDACDDVMNKVGLPRGLIRYTSASAVRSGAATWMTARIKAYFGIWCALVIAVVTLFLMRSTVDVTILRAPGTTWTRTTNGVANFYELNIINKSTHDLPYSLSIVSPAVASITPLGLKQTVATGDVLKGRFLVTVPEHPANAGLLEHEHEEHGNTEVDLVIGVNSGDHVVRQVKTELLLP